MSDQIRYWLIKFEDTDVYDLVFTDEEAAIKTYEMKLLNWSCTLFMEVDLHRERIQALEEALAEVVECAHDSDDYIDSMTLQNITYVCDQVIQPQCIQCAAGVCSAHQPPHKESKHE